MQQYHGRRVALLHAHPHGHVEPFRAFAQHGQGCYPFDGAPTVALDLRDSMDDDQLSITVCAQRDRLIEGCGSWR